MKRAATAFLVLLFASVASLALPGRADAALRAPQVPVIGASLQNYLNSVGESIDVNTDQDATQVWTHTVSTTTTFTLQFLGALSPSVMTFGLYNASAAIPPLFSLIQTGVGVGGFSVATFKPGNLLVVNRFDFLGNFVSSTTYGGVDQTSFGFFLLTPEGTQFSEDARNFNSAAAALTFAGTGANAGTWWLCWDEPLAGGDDDFDDCVVLMESVNPTPVSATSWGQLKARFR